MASPPSWVETALLDPAEWKAQWIAGPERPRALTDAEGKADDAAIQAAGGVSLGARFHYFGAPARFR
jgi:hypothetical protein